MSLHTRDYFLVIHCILMTITDTQCIRTYLYAILRLFHSLVQSVGLVSQNCLYHVTRRLQLSYHTKLVMFSAFSRQDTITCGCICPIRSVFVPHTQSSRLVYHTHCEGLHVNLSKQASKVESNHLESGHCCINRRDAECD